MSHVVARVGKPHGIRGEVTVQVHTDDPRGRFVVGTIYPTQARPGSGVPRQLTLRSARDHNGTWLLAFDEVPDRTGAEGLRGTRLLADPSTGADPVAGSVPSEGWYEEELVGLEVRTVSGDAVGTVAGLDLGAAQDRLVVRRLDGGTAYIPFVAQLVPTVDLAGRRVVIDPPPGLLELDA
jgi:16S rRNA processing protein RimM